MALGNTLAELRKKAKMTQSELGEKLSISAQAISKWENNLSEPDIDTLKKLAAIYGIAISDILETGDSTPGTEEKLAPAPVSKILYDVYLMDIDPYNTEKTIEYLTDMLGLDYGEILDALAPTPMQPYLIARGKDAENSSHISAALSMLGATVTLEPAVDKAYENDITPTPENEPKPWESEKTEKTKTNFRMRKRFIVANITAAAPALAVMIFFLSLGGGVLDVLFSIYCGIALYSLIFLAWYPTFTRKFFAPITFLISGGIFGFIFAFILMLPWILAALVIAPINYIFAIKTRIKRMKEENYNDDVFLML